MTTPIKTRAHRQEHGLCIHCGRRQAVRGQLCVACSDANAARGRDRYLELRMADLCVVCGAEPTGGMWACEGCRASKAAYKVARRARR